MENSQSSIAFIILGAFLALITSVVLEVLKFWMKSQYERKDFNISLKLEFNNIVISIDRLIDDYSKNQFYRFSILDELNSKILRIEKIRSRIIIIKDDMRREEILSLINDIYVFYSDTRTLEEIAFNRNPLGGQADSLVWNADIFKSQRQMIAIKSIDLKRKMQNLIPYLENK